MDLIIEYWDLIAAVFMLGVIYQQFTAVKERQSSIEKKQSIERTALQKEISENRREHREDIKSIQQTLNNIYGLLSKH